MTLRAPRSTARLPKWAQDEISRLKRDLAAYKAERVRIDSGDTEVFVRGPAMDADLPLPPHSTIVFQLGETRFDVSAEGDTVAVRGGSGVDTIAVFPHAANKVAVAALRRMS